MSKPQRPSLEDDALSISTLWTEDSRFGGELSEKKTAQQSWKGTVRRQHGVLSRPFQYLGWSQKKHASDNGNDTDTVKDTKPWPQDGKTRSRAIDAYLAHEWEKQKEKRRILVLGLSQPSNNLWKPLQLLSTPSTETELEEARSLLRRRVLEYAESCLREALALAEWNTQHSEVQKYANDITLQPLASRILDETASESDRAERLTALLQDPTLHSVLTSLQIDMSSVEKDVRVDDQCMYGPTCDRNRGPLAQLKRVFAPDFACDDHDWFHIPAMKFLKGMVPEAVFNRASRTLTFLKPSNSCYRHKWMHLLDKVDCILFPFEVANCGVPLEEDATVTRLDEDLMIFESICNSKYFWETPVVVVFTDMMALRESIKLPPMCNFASEHLDCNANNAEGIVDYVMDRCRSVAHCQQSIYSTSVDLADSRGLLQVVSFVEQCLK